MDTNDTAKTIIAEDVEITGSLKSASNVKLEGKINGDLTCTGNAFIGTGAVIRGNTSVNAITVLGKVAGNITAKDRLDLKASATINGDVRTKRMTMEDGVTFVGKLEVNPTGIPRDLAPERRPETGLDLDPDLSSRKEEIRNDVKDELKKGGTGGFFGRK